MKTKTIIYKIKKQSHIIVFACVLLITIGFCGCDYQSEETKITNMRERGCYTVKEIDSCEYIVSILYGKRSICHKGNCKFCAERSRK